MSEYWYTRLGIGVALCVFYAFVQLSFTNSFAGWTFIMVATTIVGFSHYFVGGYYQLKSFSRLESPKAGFTWFGGLSLAALVLSLWFIWAGQIALFAFLSIGYFMVHGFFNEITLYERQSGYEANRLNIAALVFVLAGTIFLASAHANSLFNAQFEYLLQDDYLIQLYLASSIFPTIGLYLGIGSLSLAVGFQLFATVRSAFNMLQAFFLLVIVSLAVLMLVVYPPSYVHLLSGLLLYHFIVWFIFYFRQFQKRSMRDLNVYLFIHLLAFLPFLALLFPDPVYTLIDVFVLNSYVFLTLTTIHVTVSFMSEKWFKALAYR